MPASVELRRAREAAGMSIRELAARADVAASTVWRIEAGRLDPTAGMLQRLLNATKPARPSALTREEAVSLTLGRLIAAELLRDPERVLHKARRRIAGTLAKPDLPRHARHWATEWERLLVGPLEDVVAALIDVSERGYELRQNTPFTGLLSDEDRLRAVRRLSQERRASRSA